LKCRRSDSAQSDRAVELWDAFIEARRDQRPRRHRRVVRRAYARARDRAVPWRPSLR